MTKGSPDTKLSPPSSSAAMLSTVTHCWTMSFRMAPTVAELMSRTPRAWLLVRAPLAASLDASPSKPASNVYMDR